MNRNNMLIILINKTPVNDFDLKLFKHFRKHSNQEIFVCLYLFRCDW